MSETMVTMKRGDKTEAIRQVAAEHPDWTAKQVQAELAEHGTTVSYGMVVNTLKKLRGGKKRPGRPRKADPPANGQLGGFDGPEALLSFLVVVKGIGGRERAMELLGLMERFGIE